MKRRGLFVVIEGSDGSGKATQLNLLKERLKAIGYDVEEFDFPRYEKDSSYFVRQYLSGGYGKATKLSPYTASLFYALDRFEASKSIKKALLNGKIVLANRYVGSNMAHQGAKFDDPVEQRGFFIWEDNLEFELLGIPRPDISFFLRVPSNISLKLIEERAAKTGTKLDGHEMNAKFLSKSLETYDILCRLFPKDYLAVECAKNNTLMSVAEINDLIWKKLKPLLPAERPHPSHSVVVKLGQPPKTPAGPVDAPEDELRHIFKDVSLLLRLLLQRNEKTTISPSYSGWKNSGYSYYAPQGLPRNISEQYRTTMELLAGKCQQIEDKLNRFLETQPESVKSNPQYSIDRLLLPLTPLSALASFELGVRKDGVKQLAENLLSSDGDEAQWTAQQLYLAARKKWPHDFSRPLETDGLDSISSIISNLPYNELSRLGSDDVVTVTEATPKLEFDLLAESLYPHTDLTLEEIVESVSNWTYAQKYKGLKEAASRGSILKQVRYKLDILSDQVALDRIVEISRPTFYRLQTFTARYGFDTPPIIEDAGAEDLYADCFDESLKLFSLMQGAGLDQAAAYMTLIGHRIRWQLNSDAASLKQVFEQADSSIRPLSAAIAEKVSEAHPLLWDILNGFPMEAKMPKNRVKPAHRPSKRRSRKPKKS